MHSSDSRANWITSCRFRSAKATILDNLWPFHAGGTFTLEAKQALAIKLHDMVCAGKITLKEAQDAFRKDWTKAYQQHIGKALNAPEQE